MTHYIRTLDDGSRTLMVSTASGMVSASYAIKNKLPIFGRLFKSEADLQQHLITLELTNEPT